MSTFIPAESSFVDVPSIEETPNLSFETILWLIYGTGVLLFTTRFMVNLIRMYHRISKNEKISKRSFIYVLLKDYRIPHSFFKYIFLNKLKFESKDIPKEVILHEETHAKQLHSLDIILLELLQIVFWFHPLIYLLKHHVKLNHEFLADQAVLEQGTDTKNYQNILLQFSSPDSYRDAQEYQLSSAINYSSIKKRFTVMKTQTSKTRIWLSTILLLPIIAILFYSFAEKEYVEKDNPDIVEEIKNELSEAEALQLSYIEGATEAMMQEYNDWIIKFNTTHNIDLSKYKRIVSIYDIMTEAQRKSVEPYPVIPDMNLSKVKPITPTKAQFESWKNEKEYVIWIDGKHVSNNVLNNYSVNDIVHFTGSKVYKNARSEKFPQPFQYSLYTKQGFKKSYQESALNGYKAITKTYSEAIKNYLKGPQTDNSELRILKIQADKLYNQFTKEELENYNILPAPPLPAEYDSMVVQKPVMWILVNRKNQLLVNEELASAEDIEDKLKKLSKKGKSKKLVTIKFDPKASKKLVSELENLVIKYGFEVFTVDATQIPPPPPPASKKTKGGPSVNETQDLYNPSFLEYIIEMEQLGASFYLDDEKISVADAKSLAKNNKGKSTDMITQKDADGNFMVKLSSPEKRKIYARSIDLKVLSDNSYLIDGIKATKTTFTNVINQLHQDITPEIRNKVINIHVSSSKEISNKEVWFIYNAVQDYGYHRIVTDNQEIIRSKGNTPFAIESHFSTQQKPTKKQIAEYNKLAKYYNEKLEKGNVIIKMKDVERLKYIYGLMSDKQRKSAESFPNFPKPPPPPEPEIIEVIEEQEVPAPPPSPELIEVVEVQEVPPPPPPPESTLDFVIRMAKKNAKFFNEGKLISSDEAIELIKKNDQLNINAYPKSKDGRPLVYLSKEPIKIKKKSKN